MPFVTIKMYKGRDAEIKDRVARLVTDAICDRIAVFKDGVKVEEGSSSQIISNPHE